MQKLFITILYLLTAVNGQAQKAAGVEERIQDFPVSKILNHMQPASTFRELNSGLLIIDFFGTWCAPCLKALPKLSALQQRFKKDARIILVSEEKQLKLESFLQKHSTLTLPLVVDENGEFVRIFQPPAYPYTVIVGKQGNILAIPGQEAITEENINNWLNMQEKEMVNNINSIEKPGTGLTSKLATGQPEASQNNLVQLSQNFMYAAKTGEDAAVFLRQLKEVTIDHLRSSLETDDEKKAFWINLYNAFTQISLQKDAGAYKKRGRFFGAKQHEVGGNRFSLDDIEHGILRRSKIKWSLGYFNKLFVRRTEKLLRVEQLDYRIHFALNCGAKSCPPIAFYKPENLDTQLDLATKAYLSGEATYDEGNNIVRLPKLMSWFRRDFGGKKKMIALLKKLSLLPVDKSPKIKFKAYDWTLYLQNYKT